ncbi:GAPCENA [Mytilus edulis]|uniref:RABGAP1 n=1 Tax=Mytilus edulis TaxID=6550 RepID=A0A8S3SJD8_MYTED|nr:GAPCENA [Mytilus edulis]
MKEQLLQQENPVEKFERENQRLLDANMRLEQENDDLAHEMVESKLKLGSELDKYKDQCEELSGELVVTKKLLKDIQEEKQRLEVESSQVKEMCRRELEKSEADGKRNAVIIADYKQICSQLSERLEKQQTANKEEIGRIKGQVKSCDNCSKMFKDDGKIQLPEPKIDPDSLNPKYLDLHAQIRELELELAQTKLALVESECKTQDLTHQLNSTITELQSSKNTWFQKTINSLKGASPCVPPCDKRFILSKGLRPNYKGDEKIGQHVLEKENSDYKYRLVVTNSPFKTTTLATGQIVARSLSRQKIFVNGYNDKGRRMANSTQPASDTNGKDCIPDALQNFLEPLVHNITNEMTADEIGILGIAEARWNDTGQSPGEVMIYSGHMEENALQSEGVVVMLSKEAQKI